MGSSFNQGVSFSVFIHHRPNAEGRASLLLRVIIDRKKREFGLNQSWPIAHFDKKQQIVLSRHPNDAEVDAVNMLVAEAKSRANRIKMRYFSENKMLSLDLFAKEFDHYESRDNFLYYWKQKMQHNLDEGITTIDTFKNHMTNYNRLVAYLGGSESLPFNELTVEFVRKYNGWLRSKRKNDKGELHALKHNSAVTAHSRIRTYILAAIADGMNVKNPYEKFPLNYVEGDREALEQHELAALRKLLAEGKLTETSREVLRKFLFSCYTGLRISDSAQVHSSMVKNGKIKLSLIKGSVYYGKEVSIMLPNYALELIEGRKGLLFKPISDQKCNEWLKVIQDAAGIQKSLSFHVSRDTFGTLFIELGGDVVTLSKLMGHSDVRTTMIYVKMSENRKDAMMGNFNNL